MRLYAKLKAIAITGSTRFLKAGLISNRLWCPIYGMFIPTDGKINECVVIAVWRGRL